MDEIIKKAYLSRLEDCLPVDFSDGVKFGVGLCKDKKYTEKQLLDAMSFAECYIIEHDKPLFLKSDGKPTPDCLEYIHSLNK